MGLQMAACREDWVKVIIVKNTPFFESNVYESVFSPHIDDEWKDVDIFITSTYNTLRQDFYVPTIKLPPLRFDLVVDLLKKSQQKNYDFIPFIRGRMSLRSQFEASHGYNFTIAWDALLMKMGYSYDAIRAQDFPKPFYRNISEEIDDIYEQCNGYSYYRSLRSKCISYRCYVSTEEYLFSYF